MAAFTGTPTGSDTYKLAILYPTIDLSEGWYVEHAKWTHTAAEGAGTGEINLLRLPAGKVLIDCARSRLKTTQFAAGADLHIGFRAYSTPYTTVPGGAVAEDDNFFADNLDVAGAALDQALPLPAVGKAEFNTEGGLIIYAMVDTGNIEATDTIELWLVWKPQR